MRQGTVLAALVAVCMAASAHAQTLVGTWQGTTGKQQHVLKIIQERDGALRGEFYNLGYDATANSISEIVVDGRNVKFALTYEVGDFEGVLASNGNTINGTWRTGSDPKPLTFERATTKTAWVIDSSPHKVQFVTVDKDVRLEVLDWGGDGPPLVLLAGLGNTAHVFDSLALKFTDKHHVYGITRRGFGGSSAPPPTDDNYDADRLGDDVVAVIDALKLNRPVVAGHSRSGEELSSVGSRHPEKVAGLVYLDSAYGYAFYIPEQPDAGNLLYVDMSTLRRELRELAISTPSQLGALTQEVLATLSRLQAGLAWQQKLVEGNPNSPPHFRPVRRAILEAIVLNSHAYTHIDVPVLAILAVPHDCASMGGCDHPGVQKVIATDEPWVNAVQALLPTAHIVRLPKADHNLWRSNEADVLREMNAFMDGLH